MKKILLICFWTTISTTLYSQTAIGKETVDGDALLDFGNDGKGIILPYVNEITVSNPTPGTFIFDTQSKQVVYYSQTASEEGWITMNENTNDATAPTNSTLEEVGGGVILGADSATAQGVLVLESTNKALILPKVANPHLTILSPVHGTICYDTASQTIAVFNGKEWAYWK